MGIPKYLEEKIKSIVHCCTSLAIPRTSGDTVKTSETLGGKPVYLGYFSVDLTATSPIIISNVNIETLVGAEIICKLASDEQYVVNGGDLVSGICDATVFANTTTGDLAVNFTTPHGAGDTLELYLKYTLL